MGYEYDSKVNRDLARTAMSIYTNSHNITPLNESAEINRGGENRGKGKGVSE